MLRPLFHPALHGSQLRRIETVRVFRFQPRHQCLTRRIRLDLQPHQHIDPNTLKGILTGPPVPRSSHFRRVGRADLPLTPQTRQLGEETLETFSNWRFPHSRRSRYHQGQLSFPDGVQQQHRIQASPVFIQQSFQISAGRIMLDQAVAGRGGLTVNVSRWWLPSRVLSISLNEGWKKFTRKRNAS